MKSITKLGALAFVIGASIATQAQPIDQITGQTLGPNASASQDFEAANDAFDIISIDDFSINQAYNFTSIDAGFLGWNGFSTFAAVTGYRIEIYSSVAAAGTSLTGDQGSYLVTSGFSTPGAVTSSIINVPKAFSLNAGTYWIGVMAVLNFTGGGQLGIQESTGGTPAGANGMQANPGLGFGAGSTFAPTAGSRNMAYRLNGTPVPEPGTFIAIGLGVAGLVAARRRNRK